MSVKVYNDEYGRLMAVCPEGLDVNVWQWCMKCERLEECHGEGIRSTFTEILKRAK